MISSVLGNLCPFFVIKVLITSLLVVTIPPVGIALAKLPNGDGKEALTSCLKYFQGAIFLPHVTPKHTDSVKERHRKITRIDIFVVQ